MQNDWPLKSHCGSVTQKQRERKSIHTCGNGAMVTPQIPGFQVVGSKMHSTYVLLLYLGLGCMKVNKREASSIQGYSDISSPVRIP
ncbi:hypothetical protein CR513_30117, partial [Mucuna pruriens]